MIDATKLRNLLLNDNGFGFDPATGFTYTISPTGLEVLQWLKAGASEADLVAKLAESYDVDRHNAVRDLSAFLESLGRYGLIHMEGTPSA